MKELSPLSFVLLKGTASAVPQPYSRNRALAPEGILSFLDRFLKSKLQTPTPSLVEEQAVLIHFANEDLEGSTPLQLALDELLTDSEVGMFDGNEVGNGTLVLYLYGPDAELLFRHIEPVLRADEFCRGAKAVIRWGGPNAPQRDVVL